MEFCTVAGWEDGQIAEGNLFYGLVTFIKQVGAGGETLDRAGEIPGAACRLRRAR